MHEEADITGPACELAVEALETVGNRLADMGKNNFTIFLLSVINSWAVNFIPTEQHAEFFDVIADNVHKMADCTRNELN